MLVARHRLLAVLLLVPFGWLALHFLSVCLLSVLVKCFKTVLVIKDTRQVLWTGTSVTVPWLLALDIDRKSAGLFIGPIQRE